MAKIQFYLDEMMPRAVAKGLAARGLGSSMAVDVAMVEKDDLSEHLAYAAKQGAVLVTCDKPFASKAMSVENHAGVICWTGAQNDLGGMVNALSAFAEKYTSAQTANHVFWLK